MVNGLDLVVQLENLRKLMTKYKGKFALSDFKGENMPDIIDSTFRIFYSHKPERHRLDNGLEGVKIDIYRDTVFDYASIIKSKLGGAWESYNKIISAQVALCDFYCWHCYVPDELLRGGKKTNYTSPKELMDRFVSVRGDITKDSYGSNVLRISGGEPFLAPDLILECLEYLRDKGLDKEIFVWSETNLSPFLRKNGQASMVETWLEDQGRSLKSFATFKNFALHPCLHGTTPSNFAQITLAKEEYFNQLIEALRLLFDLRIDIYPTMGSNTGPSTQMEDLFLKFKKINSELPLRFVLIQYSFENYPAIDERLSKSKRHGIIYGKNAMISVWNALLKENYKVSYAELPRYKVRLFG
jgi:uncharacterized Fe-S cluster-containing radical SAM superfamily protein